MDNNLMVKATKVVEIICNMGYEAEATTVNKNGTEMIGIIIGDGGNVRMNIYPSLTTADVNTIAEHVIKTYKENKSDTINNTLNDMLSDFLDYEKIKEKIVPYLCKGVMPNAATHKYLDLNVYYKYYNNDFGITIMNTHLDGWGITEKELEIQSMLNIKDSFDVLNISDVIPVPDLGFLMKVVTRKDHKYGSSALLFPEIFSNIDDGKKVAIIPSSIHEVLVVDANDGSGKAMAEMIQSVNATELDPTEIMGDHPYYYSDNIITEG